jgi:predicted ATPase
MQQMPSTKPLLCRSLIGRERELEQLGEVFHRTTLSIPQFLLLSGEAGMGKTRLCREFVQSKQTQSALRFWGRALPQKQAIPFAPFLDAFRRSFHMLIHVLRQQDQVPISSLAFLVQLLPELASHLPDLNMTTADAMSTPIWRQQVMFHELLRVLQLLAQHHQGPVVFVLEDLQWADETSLELLSFLAQRLEVNSAQAEPATPILLLGTYRHEALPDNPPLQQMVWHLQAQRCLTEFHLVPLNVIEHRQCINAILEQEVPEHFADFLFAWDEGNPFYTEELLGTLAATDQLQMDLQTQSPFLAEDHKLRLPSSISAAILTRFVQLPDLDQKVLTYAAVIGKTFDFPLLAAVCNIEEREIVMVLSRAMSRQLLSEITSASTQKLVLPLADRYQFRHALVRQAIYDRLHTAERRLYHRAVAEAIERLFATPEAQLAQGDQVAASLVKHYQLAGLLEQARPYALLYIPVLRRSVRVAHSGDHSSDASSLRLIWPPVRRWLVDVESGSRSSHQV